MRRALVISFALSFLTAACGTSVKLGYSLPEEQASSYPTAFLSRVVAAPDGPDLAENRGEFVVIENNAPIRVDMGGWYIEDSDGHHLPLEIGRQIDVDAELRVYSSCGESSATKVFVCAESQILDDDGDVLTLRDSAGNEVAKMSYGNAAQ